MSKHLGPEPWNHLPGGRSPAPGPLRLVQALVNTTNLESGQDAIEDAAGLRIWLTQHELISSRARVTGQDAQRARELREALRRLLMANAGEAGAADPSRVIGPAADRAGLTLGVRDGGRLELQPRAGGVDGAVGRILAAAHAAMLDGTWRRLKACRNHGCHWAFYDRSKNLSGSWCAMEICGNRRKTRAYRQRRRA